ncbi:MAG: hypothetical protein UY15_C0016G0007 [Parcubacteria group bacterium GW2011_GWA2_47_9]|nr:MAG: hypothetical protein UY15_C0016G0007 [Parcubacteria group bacterium GW2011_GWA2_47_9]
MFYKYELVFGIFFAIVGGVLGAFAQLYLLVMVTATILFLLFLAVIIDNRPDIKSSGLSFLLPCMSVAVSILVPMCIAYLVR